MRYSQYRAFILYNLPSVGMKNRSVMEVEGKPVILISYQRNRDLHGYRHDQFGDRSRDLTSSSSYAIFSLFISYRADLYDIPPHLEEIWTGHTFILGELMQTSSSILQ